MANVWDDVLPEEDRQVFEAAGWGKDVGFGEKPVLLVVDVIYNFVGDVPEPILESIKRWRYSCGERGWEGVKHLERLISAAREKQIPIVYTGMDRRPDGFDQGAWNWKSYRSGDASDIKGSLGNEIVKEIAPEPQDIYFVKDKPSAFHGTHLLDYLIYLGADTVITTGTTTSGCVRASAVDATQYNYRSIVPEECVWDRSMISHKVNLLDIQMKYGDVKKTDEVIEYFRSLPDRPCGPNTPTGKANTDQEVPK
ncbi:MAG TPA: isochorismatase family protein [Solirubrobacterales bacterium]|nr:isochorismatase family protein [Solirubrobacterales bacterium]HMY26400.1 isochorismatase family protein [Solirubrobacterales bacterium]HNA44982.1 isochorismatase family protein [Solirubrobacterales bacterium]HNC93972.1 isochorismatase family protein [Solirubrobacterales bacterium]HNF84679.1 isochorismatase family protein [Solirubrobacterales bacterium]